MALGTRLLVLHEALKRVEKEVSGGRLAPDTAAHLRQQLLADVLHTLQRVRAVPAQALLAALQAGAGNQPATGVPVGAEVGMLALPCKPKRSTCCAAAAVAVMQALGATAVAELLVQGWAVAGVQVAGGSSNGSAGAAAGKGGKKAKKQPGDNTGQEPRQKVNGPAATSASKCQVSEQVCAQLTAAAAVLKLKPCEWEGLDLVRFQLQHMPHLLERPGSGARDPRVTGFVPDGWQRKLLDVVDANGSAVVSAPTSSGKTFISSYVIQRTLREKEGRVVLVVPTKALVNQVAAQVCACCN